MDLQKNVQLLTRQCQMYQMMLQNITNLLDVAPREMLQKQLQEIESSMMQRCDDPSSAYFTAPSGYIYVLKLQGDETFDHYYYVGYTQDVTKRMYNHFHGTGAEWTKLHPPVCVLEVSEGDKADERHKTLEIMKKYGWAKTRGYCWSAKILKSPPRELES
jgi:predicted GIY-YIG superfamily endonuclease